VLEAADELIKKGADVNKSNRDGETPLMSAAKNGHMAVVELLIRSGANINATDNLGSSAVRYAQRKGRSDMVQLLQSHGGKYLGA